MTEQAKKNTSTIHVLTIGRGPAEDDKGGFDELVDAIKELKRTTGGKS